MNAPDPLWTWLAVLGIAATTLLTRTSFLVLPRGARLPALVERALRYAPACALAAIVVPALIAAHGTLDVSFGNARLLAGLAATACLLATRSMLWTIAIGMAAYTAARLL